jgi:DNA polymerase (family 10)
VYFTGSKQHNIHIRDIGVKRGLKISEYGVFRASTGRRLVSATEAEVYAAIGLPWIPPELREDAGEIEAARQGKLPDLVELDGIRGDLHCHTDATDGHHPIEALVTAAERRGYKYVAVTDHSLSARVAGGLTADELAAHVKKIRAVQARHPRITVLAGSECDILADGSLDYPDHVLAGLDLVIGAVHTGFRQSRAEMTRRICRALAHPRLHVLGHPTGRLIGKRSLRGGHRGECSAPRDDTARRWRSTPSPTGWTSTMSTPGGPTSSECWWRSRPMRTCSITSAGWSWAWPPPGGAGPRRARS